MDRLRSECGVEVILPVYYTLDKANDKIFRENKGYHVYKSFLDKIIAVDAMIKDIDIYYSIEMRKYNRLLDEEKNRIKYEVKRIDRIAEQRSAASTNHIMDDSKKMTTKLGKYKGIHDTLCKDIVKKNIVKPALIPFEYKLCINFHEYNNLLYFYANDMNNIFKYTWQVELGFFPNIISKDNVLRSRRLITNDVVLSHTFEEACKKKDIRSIFKAELIWKGFGALIEDDSFNNLWG